MTSKDLPPDALEEVADFVVFIHQKTIKARQLTQENPDACLLEELHLVNRQQQLHLEQEFADYEQRYPKE